MTDRHFTDDDSPIHVEITAASPRGVQDTSRAGDKIKEISDDALFEAFRAIYKIARKTELLIGDLNHNPDDPQALANAEVEFGLKFDSGLNAVITSSVEATITVKLTWGKS